MNINATAKFVYAIIGTTFLVGGGSVMLFHTGLLPEAAKNIVMNFSHGDSLAVHLLQEMASILIFVGLITFWFIRHYEQSKVFHWAMTAFWGLFALAHWFDGREGPRSLRGPLINTIPFVVFFIIGLLRANAPARTRR